MPSRSDIKLVQVGPKITRDQVARLKELQASQRQSRPGIALNDIYREVIEAGLAAINNAPETTKPTTTEKAVTP